MVQLEHLFNESIAENANLSNDLDSVATQPQQTQIVKFPDVVENGNNDDQSVAYGLLTQPEEGSRKDLSIETKVALKRQTVISTVIHI